MSGRCTKSVVLRYSTIYSTSISTFSLSQLVCLSAKLTDSAIKQHRPFLHRFQILSNFPLRRVEANEHRKGKKGDPQPSVTIVVSAMEC
eukprot:3114369-Rhodomonas_salina.1